MTNTNNVMYIIKIVMLVSLNRPRAFTDTYLTVKYLIISNTNLINSQLYYQNKQSYNILAC